MPQIALTLEYDGTRYHGFQFQTNAPTIQGELERAIYRFTGEAVRVRGASRTDAGVHARGQVVSFSTRALYPPETWVKALNYYLPPDIAVKSAFPVPEGFHPRREAVSREYCYFIINDPSPSPLKSRFACLIAQPLDIEAMDRASRLLIGERDFASFTPASYVKNTVRVVYKAMVRRFKRLVVFSMVANAFLPHQVRHTIGVLVRVGTGKMDIEGFRRLLEARIRGLAQPALPPCGLCLMRVNYRRAFEIPS